MSGWGAAKPALHAETIALRLADLKYRIPLNSIARLYGNASYEIHSQALFHVVRAHGHSPAAGTQSLAGSLNPTERPMSNTRTAVLSAVAALAGAAALSQAAIAGDAAKEKCYGISQAGKNDCASTGNNSCAGTAKGDYEKSAWKYVPAGTCLTTTVKLQDGTTRNGTLEPSKS